MLAAFYAGPYKRRMGNKLTWLVFAAGLVITIAAYSLGGINGKQVVQPQSQKNAPGDNTSTVIENLNNSETIEIDVSYEEDQKEATYSIEDMMERYPVNMPYDEYSIDILGDVALAESYKLKQDLYMDVLIGKDGYLGVIFDSNNIKKLIRFNTFSEAQDYKSSNYQ
ncbi:hypothetical protein BN1002_00802 [Bacillus sp. B-jedd]|nr:hypothetical protein BN1002_00802 [Bacillus sp. B-jedd]